MKANDPTNVVDVIPFGSFEQHGPHLPPDTDARIATAFAMRLLGTASPTKLKLLPTIPIGASDEHDWHSDTRGVGPEVLIQFVKDLCRRSNRTTGNSRFLFINAHGGNRSALEVASQALAHEGLTCCTAFPLSLSQRIPNGEPIDVHGGIRETSLMLKISPEVVDMKALEGLDFDQLDHDLIKRRVLMPSIYWPWRSDEPGLSVEGVIGDPTLASVESGQRLLEEGVLILQELIADLATWSCTNE